MHGYVRCAATGCWDSSIQFIWDIPVCLGHKEKIFYLATTIKNEPLSAPPTKESRGGEVTRLDRKNYTRLQLRAGRYGLTGEELQQIWDLQQGLCAICQTTLQRTGTNSFNIDHCHKSGKVRGLLCRACNPALGLFRDNPDHLRAAAAYLESDASWGNGEVVDRKSRLRKMPEPVVIVP